MWWMDTIHATDLSKYFYDARFDVVHSFLLQTCLWFRKEHFMN